jgi:hypothetical protein
MRVIATLDEIDVWAERTFQRTRQDKRVSLRKGLAKLENARTFNRLFRSERPYCPDRKCDDSRRIYGATPIA